MSGDASGLRRLLRERSRAVAEADIRRLEQEARERPGDLQQLRRLQERARLWTPGRRFVRLRAVVDRDGETHSGPSDIARAIAEYWGAAFVAPRVDDRARCRLLRCMPRFPRLDVQIDPEAVRAQLRRPRWTAPGPDGIPYAAWAAIPDLAVPALVQAADFLANSPEAEVGQLNDSVLAVVPKPMPEDESHVDAVDRGAHQVRPCDSPIPTPSCWHTWRTRCWHRWRCVYVGNTNAALLQAATCWPMLLKSRHL